MRLGKFKNLHLFPGRTSRSPESSISRHPEPPAPEPETSAETETPKPKLAYILRRGSEGAATQSYNRMTDVLNKRGK